MHKNRIEKFVTVAVLCGVLVLFALYLTHRDTNTLNSRAFHVEPLATDVPGWLTATDEIQGMTYMYPEVFGGTYSHPVEWPPSILSKRDGIACEVTNSESFPGGVVSIVSVGTRDYCLTTTSEGAAGSTYTTYTYELENGVTTIELSFTIRFVQCMNYDTPEQAVCQEEQEAFDPTQVVDQMFSSMSFEERS